MDYQGPSNPDEDLNSQVDESLARLKRVVDSHITLPHRTLSHCVVLKALPHDGHTSRTIRLRSVTEPDPAQKVILTRLGLKMPRRLRRLDAEFKQKELAQQLPLPG